MASGSCFAHELCNIENRMEAYKCVLIDWRSVAITPNLMEKSDQGMDKLCRSVERWPIDESHLLTGVG